MKLANYIIMDLNTPLTVSPLDQATLVSRILAWPIGMEGYCCTFDLDADQRKPDPDRNGLLSFKNYSGPMYPALGLLNFDFDGETALEDIRNFSNKFSPHDDLLIAFSGSKGFHCGVPFSCSPSLAPLCDTGELGKKLRALVTHVLKKDFPSMDPSVFNINGRFRLPNSRHPKTGLYKTLLSRGELNDLTLDAIKALASKYDLSRTQQLLPINPKGAPNEWLESGIVALESVSLPAVYEEGEKDEAYKQFYSFKDKKCIKALLKDRIPEGARHKTSLVIANDLFETDTRIQDAVKVMTKFCKGVGLDAEGRTEETLKMLEDVYSGRSRYSFGCSEPIKASKCSKRCGVFKRLSPEKRPAVLDAPQEGDKKDSIPHATVALQFKKTQGTDLIKQHKDLFEWVGTHWHHLSIGEMSDLKLELMELLGSECTSAILNSVWELFMLTLESVPPDVNMFDPSPFHVNFKNGTLSVSRDNATGKYTKTFYQHSKGDYLTHCFDFDMIQNDEKNSLFEALLDDAFRDDPDKEDKLKMVQECAAAMLLPTFPQMFFFIGKTHTSKSTLVKVLLKALGSGNYSTVDPVDMKNFYLEAMIGKTLNVNTDLDEEGRLNGSLIKRFYDRLPFSVNRKGLAVVQTRIAAIHVYCANSLPGNIEKTSGTMDHRIKIIECLRQISNGDKKKDYEDLVIAAGKQGILNWALQGLDRLLVQGGEYTQPNTSNEKLESWRVESDLVQQFLDLCKDGGFTARTEGSCIWELGSEGNAIHVYKAFMAFLNQMNYRAPYSMMKFGIDMKRHGVEKHRKNSGQVYTNFKVSGGDFF